MQHKLSVPTVLQVADGSGLFRHARKHRLLRLTSLQAHAERSAQTQMLASVRKAAVCSRKARVTMLREPEVLAGPVQQQCTQRASNVTSAPHRIHMGGACAAQGSGYCHVLSQNALPAFRMFISKRGRAQNLFTGRNASVRRASSSCWQKDPGTRWS